MHPYLNSSSGDGALIVLQAELLPERVEEFAAAQAKASLALMSRPGYLGYDVHVGSDSTQQTVVRRFTSVGHATDWMESSAFEELLSAETACMSTTARRSVVRIPITQAQVATSTITTRVKPGSEEWFRQWQATMLSREQEFPGFLGQHIQAPISGVTDEWVSIIAFAGDEQLRAWMHSPDRKALLKESASHVDRFDVRPSQSAFESWFAGAESGMRPPPAWKLSAIVLLVLYPVVMLEIFTLNQWLASWGTALATFIGNAVSVALTGFLLIPWASRLLRWWLVPPAEESTRRTAIGAIVVVGLYAASVGFFWAVTAAWGT
ncbi:MAG: antibiotic biosynthesis monooxygenase [Actinobacteria bacterium]|nr:antibiotic biosynthesis monooxygenase [Actinomycetota bacterium]MCB9413034.1 antibiotic biosynthesis monooxygenase [Actinomycetota bacterium]